MARCTQGKKMRGEIVPADGEGEFFWMDERLVVAPAWGRFHAGPVQEGERLRGGSVIGQLSQGASQILLVCPFASVFLSWLVMEGERVRPGMPVARLRSTEE